MFIQDDPDGDEDGELGKAVQENDVTMRVFTIPSVA
jgi:hypothetical protein